MPQDDTTVSVLNEYLNPTLPYRQFNQFWKLLEKNAKTVQKGILRIVDPRKEESLGLFMCPITQDVFVNPVVASDGYTYSKYALKKWALTSINKHRVPVP